MQEVYAWTGVAVYKPGEVMDREWQKTNENDKIYGDNVGEIKKIHTLQHQNKI